MWELNVQTNYYRNTINRRMELKQLIFHSLTVCYVATVLLIKLGTKRGQNVHNYHIEWGRAWVPILSVDIQISKSRKR